MPSPASRAEFIDDMCGIAGLAGATDRDGARGRVRQMLSTLARRGPDGEGLEVWEGAVLGHRRLAIFDLSDPGYQPIKSPISPTGIFLNGEIYNSREFRLELKADVYHFKIHTNT